MSRDLDVIFVDGYKVQMNDFRKHLNLQTDTFKCEICKKKKKYPTEYGGTYSKNKKMFHICIECIEDRMADLIVKTTSKDK